jgi:hypothetical protein
MGHSISPQKHKGARKAHGPDRRKLNAQFYSMIEGFHKVFIKPGVSARSAQARRLCHQKEPFAVMYFP